MATKDATRFDAESYLGEMPYSRSNNLPSLRLNSTISTRVSRGATTSYELRLTSCIFSSSALVSVAEVTFSSKAGGGCGGVGEAGEVGAVEWSWSDE